MHNITVCKMRLALLLLILAALSIVTNSSELDSDCNACSCHLDINDVPVLGQLIKAKIATALANNTSKLK